MTLRETKLHLDMEDRWGGWSPISVYNVIE